MKRSLALLAAVFAVAASAALAVPAHALGFSGPCAPSTGSHSATTTLTNRPDSGGASIWATDGKVTPATPTAKVTRTLKITLVSQAGGIWTWNATVCDGGTGQTIPGALAPNQGPGHAGDAESSPSQQFTINGTDTYAFTTDQPLNTGPNLGVPSSEDGAPVTPGQTTPLWFTQAFPGTANFTGGQLTFDYDYATTGLFAPLRWHDATGTDGQAPADGQIK